MTKSRVLGVGAVLGGILAAGVWLAGCGVTVQEVAPPAPEVSVERGEYLVSSVGCHDCHTPMAMGPNGPEWDMTRMLSGHPEGLVMPPTPELERPWGFVGAMTLTAFAGPWGVSYSSNLTPDENTGLGIWTEQMFVDAIRKGRHMGVSRPIMPPMPWPWYSKMTDEDLKSIYAYLRTIPPIQNRVPDAVPAGG